MATERTLLDHQARRHAPQPDRQDHRPLRNRRACASSRKSALWLSHEAGRGVLRRAQGAPVLPRPGQVHDLGPGGGAGARRRQRRRQEPRSDGRDRSGEGRRPARSARTSPSRSKRTPSTAPTAPRTPRSKSNSSSPTPKSSGSPLTLSSRKLGEPECAAFGFASLTIRDPGETGSKSPPGLLGPGSQASLDRFAIELR